MEGFKSCTGMLDRFSNQGYESNTGKITAPFGWWSPTYLYDYVALIVLLYMLVQPFTVFNVYTTSVFDLSDEGVQRPLYDDQLTVEEIAIMIIVPSAFMYAVFFVRRLDWLEDLHSIFCTLAAALMISNFCYFTLKTAVSRPRPDVVARCAPACLQNITWMCTTVDNYNVPELCADSTCCPIQCGVVDPRYKPGTAVTCPITDTPLWQACGSLWGRLITVEEADCRGSPGDGVYSPYTIQQGFTSFPSGHVINISGVFMFNWLYLAGKMQVYGRNIQQRMLLPGFAFMSAFAFAVLFVIETRISNNKHRISDCIAGFLVGVVPMWFVYPIYFQSIFLGGEPLRRPKMRCMNMLSHLCCRDRALQQPWPQEGWLPLPVLRKQPSEDLEDNQGIIGSTNSASVETNKDVDAGSTSLAKTDVDGVELEATDATMTENSQQRAMAQV
mmetsp:Transcript_17669/g.34776  ORF Transcript_17669/g.34776 Transcript_17669/m.34776 type:complete len:443 (-) Transcript_17669:699-2027(-)|eukprot:CAMPEP_0171489420 /NCGR_PEP_ID=MMETSP0958-20121227/2746_1 /TAXON_ID=87120 /ORGANISM="Aurantiochytrium limacinum, Strain ATCCMYA-1381" /LENGTH=442 /DNA_ID=CAMNT_0012022629 /DNA_START=597 /DNA_END=1925 /DNA_ORIENTATION=+